MSGRHGNQKSSQMAKTGNGAPNAKVKAKVGGAVVGSQGAPSTEMGGARESRKASTRAGRSVAHPKGVEACKTPPPPAEAVADTTCGGNLGRMGCSPVTTSGVRSNGHPDQVPDSGSGAQGAAVSSRGVAKPLGVNGEEVKYMKSAFCNHKNILSHRSTSYHWDNYFLQMLLTDVTDHIS